MGKDKMQGFCWENNHSKIMIKYIYIHIQNKESVLKTLLQKYGIWINII